MIVQFGRYINELERRMQRRDRKRIEKLKRRKTELIRRLEYCEYHKKKISNFVKELNGQYKHGLISYEKYCKRLDRTLKQRTLEQWISYYNDWIKHYNKDLRVCEREIREEKKAPDIVPVIAVITMLLLLGISVVFIKPSILGSVVYEPGYDLAIELSQNLDIMYDKANHMCAQATSGNHDVAYSESRDLLTFLKAEVKPDSERVYAMACK